MAKLPIQACIVGAAETAFTRDASSTKSDLDLQLQASLLAIEDAGLERADIDGLIAPPFGGKAEDFSINLGLDLAFSVTSHTGGAAAVAALQSAAMAVSFRLAKHVLIPAGWCGYSRGRGRSAVSVFKGDMGSAQIVQSYYHPFGAVGAVTQYALVANHYVRRYGIGLDSTAAVALAMRKHAQINPNAVMYGRPMTKEEYLSSPLVSTPFRILDCALRTDGAAAVVVSACDRATDLRHTPVRVLGVAEGRPMPIDDLMGREDLLQSGVGKASSKAFANAGLRPADMNFLQTYDSFTVNVLRQLEDAGFCKQGEGGEFVHAGRIELGGALPVNTHGGMLSAGDAQGMNHLVEAVVQLRGKGGLRQVADAKLGAVIGMGGGWGTAAVAVLGREGAV